MDESPPYVPPNPYAPPRVEGSPISPAADIGAPLTRDEVQAFVGEKKASYYWTHWFGREQRHLGSAGFNTPAFFLNLWWLLYRRMFREFAVAVGAVMGIEIVLAVLEQVAHWGDLSRALDQAGRIAIGATIGAMGNGLYLRRAKAVVAAARAQESDPARRLELIRRKGGVSWLAALLGVAGTIAIGVLMAFVAASEP